MCSLNVPLQKVFRWFRRLQLWATAAWQLHHNTSTHAPRLMQRFLTKHQITQVTQAPYSPDLVPCNFWLFPKLKSPLKGKRFQTVNEIQENRSGQQMAVGRTVWGPKVPPWRRLRHHCPVYNVSSINVSIFHITWLDTFWADPLHVSSKPKGLLTTYQKSKSLLPVQDNKSQYSFTVRDS